MTAEKIRSAFRCLLEDTQVLSHLSKNQMQQLAVARVGDGVEARCPAIDKCRLVTGICIDDRFGAFTGGFPADLVRRIGGRAAMTEPRSTFPSE